MGICDKDIHGLGSRGLRKLSFPCFGGGREPNSPGANTEQHACAGRSDVTLTWRSVVLRQLKKTPKGLIVPWCGLPVLLILVQVNYDSRGLLWQKQGLCEGN